MSTFVLIVLVLVLAALGGFLGDLLEFAFWAVVLTAALFAALGFLAYRSVAKRLR